MSTILVEARRDPNCQPILDALASTCAALGHEVIRWRGPLSGRVPYRRRLRRCDLAILFNGAHCTYEKPLLQLRRWQTKLQFVELGWHPQIGTFQLDSQGINAAASWSGQPLTAIARNKLAVRSNGDLLVLLQDDSDTQITAHSPWFADMYEFVSHLCQHSQLPLSVRAHPRHPPGDRLRQLIDRHGCRMDTGQSLAHALSDCRAVACINSSAAVEAMAAGIPVLCFGRAIYRHAGAVYCLDNDGNRTRQVTIALSEGVSELNVESIQEVLERIVARQWRIDQIPHRLPAVLDTIAKKAAPPMTGRGWYWPFKTPAGWGTKIEGFAK